MEDVAWIWLVVALVGLSLSALFSGLETGAYCIDRVRLFVLAHAKETTRQTRRAVALRRELQNPGRLLSILLISNNIANYLGTMGVAGVLDTFGLTDWQSIIINAAVLTPMLFLFGETLPKDLFTAEADRLTLRLSVLIPLLRFLLTISLLLPIVRTIGAILERLAQGGSSAEVSASQQRIANLMKEGARHGILSETQTSLVDRAVAFRKVSAGDEMTPLARAFPIGDDWLREQTLRRLQGAPGQWRPVVDRRRRVVGVVRTLDILIRPEAPVRQIMLKAPVIDAEATAPAALAVLRAGAAHMGVVQLNGRTVGVITVDDLVEPLTAIDESFQSTNE